MISGKLALLTHRTRGCNLIVLVINAERGMASQADIAAASVGKGKPEVAHLRIDLLDLCLFRPKRRILCGRGLKAHHGKIFSVHPNSAAIQKLVVGSGL